MQVTLYYRSCWIVSSHSILAEKTQNVYSYFTVPNNRPGQSYLFSTFVPPRMPLLGTGRLLISGKYSRQDVYLGQDISKKCVLVLFFPACLFIYFLLKKSHFHLITDSECYELSAVHNVTFPKISVRTRVLSRNSWCFEILTSIEIIVSLWIFPKYPGSGVI